jgi:hypothetical protein
LLVLDKDDEAAAICARFLLGGFLLCLCAGSRSMQSL